MATWTFSGYNNGRGAEVTFTYTAAFDPATNKTKVTITNYTAAFNTGGAKGYCALTGTLTVKAADNTGSYGTLDVSASKSNASSPTVSTDVSQVIEVSHGTGTSKQIILAFSGTINAVTYFTYPEESTTVSVYTAAAYTLTLNKGTGTNLVVDLYASPFRSTFSGFTTGAVIYGGEILRVWGSESSGAYKNFVLNVSGVGNLSTGDTFTVTGSCTVKTTAVLKTYTLTINADSHAAVTVTRSGAALASGAAIKHFDLLAVTVSAKAGYEVSAADINGTAISPDVEASHTVSGPVTVTVLTETMPGVLLDVGGVRKRFLILIDSGGVRKNFRAIFK